MTRHLAAVTLLLVDNYDEAIRSAPVDHIETYLNTLLWTSPEGIDSMRALDGTP